MAPSFVTIDNTPDFDFTPQPQPTKKAVDSTTRTLLIAPPSIASHEEKLHGVLAVHDRSVTDLQMLDRISAGLARLPLATYDLIIILTDVDGTRSESGKLLSRDVYSSLVQSLKAGGKLQSQDGTFGQSTTSGEYTEAILAGLVANSAGGMMKPDYSASEAVPLRFGRNKKKDAVSDAGPPATIVTLKRKSVEAAPAKPNGVGFVDFSDDFGEPEEDDDDDLIDEDTLLTEEDLNSMIVIRMSTPITTCRRELTSHSTGVCTKSWQASSRLQRLHLRLGEEDLSRRREEAQYRWREAQGAQTRFVGPRRSRFYREGQGRVVRKL